MPEPFLLKKAVDVSGAALGKASSSTFKGLLVIGAIGVVGYSLYITLIKPHFNPLKTTEQRAEQIVNYNYHVEPRQALFGCQNFRIMQEKIKNEKTENNQTVSGTTK